MRLAYVLPALLLTSVLLTSAAHAQTRYQWVGGNSGDWTEPANWSPNGVPAAADTAVIGPSNNAAILTATTTLAGLEVAGLGAVAGDFDLTVTDHLQWEGGGAGFGTFRGTGAITIAAGATGRMAEPTTRFEMSSGRTLVNDGLLLWDGPGSWNGQGRLVNNGELVLAMGETGTFGFIFSSLPDAITNTASGVIRRDGPGTAEWQSGAVNDGSIRVESGVLRLRGFNSDGVRGTGTLEVADGARLDIAGGVHIVDRVTGSLVDIVQGNSGQLRVSGDYDVTTTRLSGFGALRLDGASTTETLELDDGRIEGEGTLTVTGSVAWTGGTMEGTGTTVLGPSIPLDISGTELRLSGSRTLRLEGPTTWSGEADISSGSSTTTIINAGTMTSTGPGERRTSFVTFQNEGTIVHDGGTLHIDSPMANPGTIRIEDGTFKLGFNASGTDSGRYEIGDAGLLDIAVRSRTLAESAEIVGTGTVTFTSLNAVNRATWRPGGDGVGTLTVEGDWPAMEPEGVLAFEVGGTAPGTERDQIDVTGTFAAGGTVRVALTNGFTPTTDAPLLLVAAVGGARGTFDGAELPETTPPGYVQAMSEGVRYGLGEPVANEDNGGALPTAFALDAPYPNPATTSATLAYAVPEATPVRLVLYDVLGRQVAVLAAGVRAAGWHEASLTGARLPSGMYVVRLEAGGVTQTRRFTIVW